MKYHKSLLGLVLKYTHPNIPLTFIIYIAPGINVNMGDFPGVARASFFKGPGRLLMGFTQSKRWPNKVALSAVQASQDQQNNSVKHRSRNCTFTLFTSQPGKSTNGFKKYFTSHTETTWSVGLAHKSKTIHKSTI